jgi:YVTN family beta-propeller protein
VISPDFSHLYVVNNSTVSVIRLSDNTVVATLPCSGPTTFPTDICVTPDGTHVYVLNYGDGTQANSSVDVIRTSDNTIVHTTTNIGDNVQFITAAPDSAHVYVNANTGTPNAVVAIETTGFTKVNITGVGTPGQVAVAADSAHIYVPDANTNVIKVVATPANTVSATITVQTGPILTAMSPDGANLYVLDQAGTSVKVIDTGSNTVVATVTLGGISPFEYGLTVSPDNANVYVTDYTGGTVTIIETTGFTIVTTVGVGTNPTFSVLEASSANVVIGSTDQVSIIKASDQSVFTVPDAIDYGTFTTLRFNGVAITDLGGGVAQIDDSASIGPKWLNGAGSPESVVVGSPGDLYTNVTGGTGTTLYVKESGNATNTGWIGK